MRLLNVHSLQFGEFFETDIPPYCILSHRWGPNELSYKEFRKGVNCSGPGYEKIVDFCGLVRDRQVKEYQYVEGDLVHVDVEVEWVWVDTVCIDKRSSAELSEAINSMFKWYQRSVECVVYLKDVDMNKMDGSRDQKLARSSWFTRGWTLQELLAPNQCVVFDGSWGVIGHVCSQCQWTGACIQNSEALNGPPLAVPISKITNVPLRYIVKHGILGSQFIRTASVAQRMSWASHRITTRKEDTAYCLLGLFGINMPLLYGEGEMAFTRLQEEIIKQSTDQSIFAWDTLYASKETGRVLRGLLATSPRDFAKSGTIRGTRGNKSSYALINKGLQIESDAIAVSKAKLEEAGHSVFTSKRDEQFSFHEGYLLPLNCYDTAFNSVEDPCGGRIRPCFLAIQNQTSGDRFWRVSFNDKMTLREHDFNLSARTKSQFIIEKHDFWAKDFYSTGIDKQAKTH